MTIGATTLIDELTEDIKVKDSVIQYFRQLGNEVLDVPFLKNEDLSYGINKSNEWD